MAWTIVSTVDLSGVPEAAAALEAVGVLENLLPDRHIVLAHLGACDAYMASAAVRIDEEFLSRAGRLRVIGSPHTGTDHMDLDRIAERGIELFTIAREGKLLEGFTATSELAFALLLALVRRLPAALEAARRGDWARERFSGFQLLGKTFGVLGLGRLGRMSARIAKGFGMRVISHDVADVSIDGVEMVGFDTLLRESDALSIHVHLNEETRGLIDAPALSRMKPSAILLNTSRGAIVDEAALLEALRSGRLGGAGLDVVDGEWLSREELAAHPLIAYARQHDNLLIVPHIGGSTIESIYGARVFMARKLADYLRRQATHSTSVAATHS